MKAITTVGSREVPHDIKALMTDCGYHFVKKGYKTREGGALGSDESFYQGVERYWIENGYNATQAERYLPEDGSRGLYRTQGEHIYVLEDLPHQELAAAIAEKIHPAWHHCKEFARRLHTRNVYQVLGKDLLTPSVMLICWAPPTRDSISGGTRTAWEIARHNNIPCVNLHLKDNVERSVAMLGYDKDFVIKQNEWRVSEYLMPVFMEYCEKNPEYKEQFMQQCKNGATPA